MALYNNLVHNVLLLPGGPTIIIGIRFSKDMRIMNKFSLNVYVKAIDLNYYPISIILYIFSISSLTL